MTWRTLIRRSLRFHARSHFGVVLGAAIGSAALTGALLVGDSVRESLRERALARLGWVELALAPNDRLFSQKLADVYEPPHRLQKGSAEHSAVALRLPATANSEDGSARANDVNLFGIDSVFAPNNSPLHDIPSNGVVLNEALARQLHAKAGDEIVLRSRKPSALSHELPVSPRNEGAVAMRLRVHAIVPPNAMGDFALSANQAAPLNAFVRLDELSESAGLQGKANLLLLGPLQSGLPRWFANISQGGKLKRWLNVQWLKFRIWLGATTLGQPLTPEEQLALANNQLSNVISLSYWGLNLHPLENGAGFELRSDRVFLDPEFLRAANDPHTRLSPPIFPAPPTALASLATATTTNHIEILTYLANLLRAGTNATPYSMVTAAGPPYTPPDLKDDEIVISQWLADDLHAQLGDTIELSWFQPESGVNLLEATNRFRVRSIVPLEPPWADRTLMPDFPGIQKAESTRDWDAGFPLTYRIRPQDEEYWKQHRGTPKAFVTLAAGQKMWANRFGNITAIRFPTPKGMDADGFRKVLEPKLIATINPQAIGLSFEAVRAQALKAANQSQDFGQLFLGFSIFLVVAALLLMALLFQFGLEQRLAEVGILLAVGLTPKQVRRLLLCEGAALALLGGALGVVGGVIYAKAMLWGLATIWHSAVGLSALNFHFTAVSVLIGALASIIVAVLTIWLTLRKQARQPARQLLAGEAHISAAGSGKLHVWIAFASGAAAVALVAWALARGDTANAGAFFGAGSLLLLAGFASVAGWLARLARNSHATRLTLSALTVRGCARRRKRSLATVALLACGSFVILSIGVFRLDANLQATQKSSGTGGFALIGQSTLPVVHDLNTKSGRDFFGLNDTDLAGIRVVPFRVREGDDASCLNLNRAQKPRLLGVKPELLAGRFTFTKAASGLDRGKGWQLLVPQGQNSSQSPEEIPAIGDANSIQWALGKKVGDTIDYTDEYGRAFKLRLVGAVANSILQGNLVIDEAEFMKRFPSESGYRMFLLDAPAGSLSSASKVLSRALQDVGLELTPAADRLNAFNAVQNTYLGTFQVLGGLGLLLGSAGLGIVVLRNVLERRGELALLIAVGFRRRGLQRLVLGEHAALLALGLGIGLAAAAVAVLPALLSPGTHLPYGSLALTLGVVLVNGLIWTWMATRVALRGRLLDALRNE